MNETTGKLLEQLAAKLGTTANALWEILLKQAPIEASIDLLYLAITTIWGVALYKIHKKLLAPVEGNEYRSSGYYVYEEGALIPMVAGLLIFIILFLAIICTFGEIINGFFHPEYWALQKILDTIKPN